MLIPSLLAPPAAAAVSICRLTADTNFRHVRISALVKLVKDNRVETGLLAGVGGGGAGGGRRGARSHGRNPKNILGVLAADTSLGIPEFFRDLVGGKSVGVLVALSPCMFQSCYVFALHRPILECMIMMMMKPFLLFAHTRYLVFLMPASGRCRG